MNHIFFYRCNLFISKGEQQCQIAVDRVHQRLKGGHVQRVENHAQRNGLLNGI